MKCKKCGKELESDWKICPVCGEPAEETSGSKELIKKKKPVYKKIWFWVLVVFVCFIGLAVYGSTLPDEGEEQKSTENKVTDFSEYDFKELLSQPESEAKSIGLEKKGKENIYTGLDEEIQVVYKEGVVQTIQIKGEGAKTPTFYGVRIGMEKTEIDGKLKESYSEKIEAESEQKFINLQTKESVICGIAEGKVNTITFQKLSDEEIAEYQKVKEEQLRAQYIFPDSDSKYLSEDEVRSVEADKLAFGRNEIFARHGYIFKGEEFQKYFESTSWYEGTVPNDQFDSEKVFNDFEKKNVELIQKVEDEVNGKSEESSGVFIGMSGTYQCGSDPQSGVIDVYVQGTELYVAMGTHENPGFIGGVGGGIQGTIQNSTTAVVDYGGGCVFTLVWSDTGAFKITRSGSSGYEEIDVITDNVEYVNADYYHVS